MWRPKWDNLSIRPNIEVVVDASKSRGSAPPRTPPLSRIPRVTVEEVVVPESETDGRVRGERHRKHCEFGKLAEVLTGSDRVDSLDDTERAELFVV